MKKKWRELWSRRPRLGRGGEDGPESPFDGGPGPDDLGTVRLPPAYGGDGISAAGAAVSAATERDCVSDGLLEHREC